MMFMIASDQETVGFIITVLVNKYDSIPQSPKSFPIPESLYPPKGVGPSV